MGKAPKKERRFLRPGGQRDSFRPRSVAREGHRYGCDAQVRDATCTDRFCCSIVFEQSDCLPSHAQDTREEHV